MYSKIVLLIAPLICFGCHEPSTGQQAASYTRTGIVNEQGRTVTERFAAPPGYERGDAGPFGKYLRSLPLEPDGSSVRYYDGRKKVNNGVYCAVVNMDIGRLNLQQCADAVMRLRAEYLFNSQQAEKIHFNFTNGFRADYSKWRNGYRIAIKDNDVSWVQQQGADDSYNSFREYMNVVFSYAGTLSLSRELVPVPYGDMAIGDVLIHGGSPGHAVIVVDVAENRSGRKVYLLAQSYMPAQDIQILVNPVNANISPWYELDMNTEVIRTPEWDFTRNDLKRFREE